MDQLGMMSEINETRAQSKEDASYLLLYSVDQGHKC